MCNRRRTIDLLGGLFANTFVGEGAGAGRAEGIADRVDEGNATGGDLDNLAVAERNASRNRFAVDEGAVSRAEIFDFPIPVLKKDFRVMPAGSVIWNNNCTRGRTPDCEGLVGLKPKDVRPASTLPNHQVCRRGFLLRKSHDSTILDTNRRDIRQVQRGVVPPCPSNKPYRSPRAILYEN